MVSSVKILDVKYVLSAFMFSLRGPFCCLTLVLFLCLSFRIQQLQICQAYLNGFLAVSVTYYSSWVSTGEYSRQCTHYIFTLERFRTFFVLFHLGLVPNYSIFLPWGFKRCPCRVPCYFWWKIMLCHLTAHVFSMRCSRFFFVFLKLLVLFGQSNW